MTTASVSFEEFEPGIEEIIEWNKIPVDLTPIFEWARMKIDLTPEVREASVRSVWTRLSRQKQGRTIFPTR